MNGHQRARGCFAPILAIETSCDETAAAVLDEHERVLANIISSQQALHERFGGVVPELASRAHIQNVEHVTAQALREAGLSFCDLRAIAVTQGPGLPEHYSSVSVTQKHWAMPSKFRWWESAIWRAILPRLGLTVRHFQETVSY